MTGRKIAYIPNMGSANDVTITAELITVDPKIIEMLEYMEANDWELNLGCIPSTNAEWSAGKYMGLESSDYINSTGAFATGGDYAGLGLYDVYTTITDNYPSIKLWMSIEYSTNPVFWGSNYHTPGLDWNAVDADWDLAFSTNVEWILANYPNFQGFTTEYLTDNGLVWFYNKTQDAGKLFMLWWPRDRENWSTYPTTETLAWHVAHTDIMAYEPFAVEDVTPWGLDYYTAVLAARTTGKLIGFHTNYNGWQNCVSGGVDENEKYVNPVSVTPYWDIQTSGFNACDAGKRSIMPKATQKARIKSAANTCKEILTTFDVVEAMFGYQDCVEEDTPTQQLRFYDSLNLTTSDTTYYPQTITKRGYTPEYKDVCGSTAAVSDVFANTGTEILLLKAKTVGDEGVKTITVSGTGSLGVTVKTYTPTVISAHATLIGTFPTSDFGNTITVAYDSTGLKLSVLKEV